MAKKATKTAKKAKKKQASNGRPASRRPVAVAEDNNPVASLATSMRASFRSNFLRKSH